MAQCDSKGKGIDHFNFTCEIHLGDSGLSLHDWQFGVVDHLFLKRHTYPRIVIF